MSKNAINLNRVDLIILAGKSICVYGGDIVIAKFEFNNEQEALANYDRIIEETGFYEPVK